MTLERLLRWTAPLVLVGAFSAADCRAQDTVRYAPVVNDPGYNAARDESMTLRDSETYIDKICGATDGKGLEIKKEYAADICRYVSDKKLTSTIDLVACPVLRTPAIVVKMTLDAKGKVKRKDYVVRISGYTTATDDNSQVFEKEVGFAELTPAQFNALCVAVMSYAKLADNGKGTRPK